MIWSCTERSIMSWRRQVTVPVYAILESCTWRMGWFSGSCHARNTQLNRRELRRAKGIIGDLWGWDRASSLFFKETKLCNHTVFLSVLQQQQLNLLTNFKWAWKKGKGLNPWAPAGLMKISTQIKDALICAPTKEQVKVWNQLHYLTQENAMLSSKRRLHEVCRWWNCYFLYTYVFLKRPRLLSFFFFFLKIIKMHCSM